jgi:hypothetical protein
MYSYSKTNHEDRPHLVTRKGSRARDPLTTIYETPSTRTWKEYLGCLPDLALEEGGVVA